MIPRLYDVTGGAVKVAGVDVRDYNLEVLRDQVSMVLQKMYYFPVRSTIIFAGAMNRPVMRKLRESAVWHRQMDL